MWCFLLTFRYHNVSSTDALRDQVATQDAIQERRRAKAMKLLDAKLAQLSQETEGWGDVRC